MGSLFAPSSSDYKQLFLDTAPNACANDGSSGTVTMTSYAAAGQDINQALGMDVMLGYIVSGADNTGLWTLVLKLGSVTLLTDTMPHSGQVNPLTNTGYCKLRFMLQSAATAGSAYLDGFQQDGISKANSALTPMTLFGTAVGAAFAPPIVSLNMTAPFNLSLLATSNAVGGGSIVLTNLYTRYYRIGP